jgi:hypothetical protein
VDAEPEALPQCLKTGTLGSDGLFTGGKSVLLCWGARAIEVDSEPEAKGLTGVTILVQPFTQGTGESNVAQSLMIKLWQDSRQ